MKAMSWAISMPKSQCAFAIPRDQVVAGHPKPHIWNQRLIGYV